MRAAFNGCCYDEHAEMNAIKKLPINKKARKIYLDFCVIRTNRLQELRSSKPCHICLKHMLYLQNRGYIVRNIYYVNEYNILTKDKFTDLLNSDNKHITRRFRKY